MKAIDRRLLLVVTALFAIVLIVRVVPMLKDKYRQDNAEIARLEVQIERFKRLVNEEDLLAQREINMAQHVEELESWVFRGNTESLIGSSVQQELRQVVAGTDIIVREMKVAEYKHLQDWLMVSQEMTFTIQQKDIIEFFNLLENSIPHLHIAEFGITRTRRVYNANLTVVGFSRALTNNPSSSGIL